MSQNEPKQRNATQNQQQRFVVNFSLTCSHPDRFDNSFINRRGYLLGHFKDEFNFSSIYKSSR